MIFEQKNIALNQIKFNVDNFDINVMEYCLKICNFHYSIKDPDYHMPYNREVELATQYITQLGESLFYQKYDSKLVKELLLWYTAQDRRTQSLFSGFILMCLKKTINYFIIDLNLYRLGFQDAILFRLSINTSFIRGELEVKGELGFKQFLVDLIAEYKQVYPYDEVDNKAFSELINYNWPLWMLKKFAFIK